MVKERNMSRLIDRLERLSEGRDQPLGFGTAVSRVKSLPVLVVASVPVENVNPAVIAQIEGVDAILIKVEHHKKKTESLIKLNSKKLDFTWGVLAETITREESQQLVENGCDFVIFAPDETPAAMLREDRIGKILQIDTCLSEDLARAIRHLSVDAVFLMPASKDEYPLTVHQLMIYARLAAGAGKHLLAYIPGGITDEDLESLWELGVRGVVVDIMPGDNAEQKLAQVMKAIEKLPRTRKKHREKSRATLPLPSPSTNSVTEEEEEEEEEEDN